MSAAPSFETLRDQLHLVEGQGTQLKKALETQSEYLGLMMREIIEIRADAKAGKALGEFVTLRLSPLLNDPTLLVDLEELRRAYETDREERIAAMPPRRPHPSFDDLSPTGQHRAITEAELKLTMALDRVRELEDRQEERDKAHGAEIALVQKQLDSRDATRKFWFKTIVSVVGIVVSGVAVWQITTTLATREKTTTTQIKEQQR